mgnify:CR=1 FL=1
MGESENIGTQANVSTTVPAHTSPEDKKPEGDGNGFAIPEGYKDKPYMKGIDSEEALYKAFDGVQSLLGQKVTFPDDNTTDENRLAFNRAAGMPEKAEEYLFEREEKDKVNVDPAFDLKVKSLFHETGLSGKAATKLQKGFEKIAKEMETNGQEALDKEFETLSKQTFGDQKEVILASSKKLLEEHAPEAFKKHIAELDNQSLVLLASVLNEIKTKYIDEDNINDKNLQKGGEGGVEDLRKKGRELMKLPGFKDAFHPDHKKIHEQKAEIYAQIGKLLST